MEGKVMKQPVIEYPPLDYEAARQRMVDAQIRPAQVNDPRIITAMRHVPRELAVPESLREFAYADQSLPLPDGRVLTEPRVVARMLQVAAPRQGDRVLIVGAGTGYLPALASRMEEGLRIDALESDRTLAAIGQALCRTFAPDVSWHIGPLAAGVPDNAPYDLILIDGAVRAIPPALLSQCAADGRVVAPIWPADSVASVCIVQPTAEGAGATRAMFDANVPLLPELAPAPAFSFDSVA
ncbi:protein-L-isoaspartate O-methyltransferase [Novacetimonas pomaceti]|uniref:Protein-L-isoaspartate O-methyltransferase n=2 Tax=Novacetimonas pomaceti TaxID=2021998 RepID=A0ABX5P8N5_9PROT|nr:protein-L-isoaspartate O-methyltransferase [Novacetimonas pomaceti]